MTPYLVAANLVFLHSLGHKQTVVVNFERPFRERHGLSHPLRTFALNE